MQYGQVISGIFIERPNRFVAKVETEGQVQTVHVKNTGRCKELLRPGTKVWLSRADQPKRKTEYDLIAVEKQRPGKPPLLVNMDSQIPNAVAAQWLRESGLFSTEAELRREVTYGASRFDLFVRDGQRRAFVEVKGVTLEQDGIAAFPDAPTQRGVKHLQELIRCRQEGYEAYLLFIVQMEGISLLRPNDETHPAFGEALRAAAEAGVHILAMGCRVTENSLWADYPIPVDLR